MSAFLYSALAQTPQASLVGTCLDSSGAAIPGAELVARNVATNAQFKAKTNDSGNFVLPLLPVGEYDVTSTAQGFRTVVRSGIVLEVGDRTRVDFTLQVGISEQKIDVVVQAPLVQTETSGLGGVVENKRISELPLNSRNVLSLTLVNPGVRNLQGGINLGFGRSQGNQVANIGINGSVSGFTAFLMDGAIDTSIGYGDVAVAPLVESIQEFKILTNFAPPEFGLTNGGLVNTVTKSGTNELHGSVYEYLRNNKFDARNTFSPSVPPFRYNQFGVSAGGPVTLPKIYSGKDQTFFFFNYEGSRRRAVGNPITSVPIAQWRNGDFSNLRNAAGVPILIYDTASTAPNPNGAGFIRQPFPNNVIPGNLIDRVAKNVLAFFPQPNQAPNNPLTQSLNYLGIQPLTTDVNQYHARADHTFSNQNRMFARWSFNREQANRPDNPTSWPDPVLYARYDQIQNQQAMLSDIHTFSATLLNEGRLSLMRQDFPFTQGSYNQGWPQKLGFPASVPGTLFPLFTMDGYDQIGGVGTTGLRYSTAYQLYDMVTKIQGNHSLKFGTDIRVYRYANFQVTSPSGSYTFPASLTGNPQSQTGTGYGLATFLLGAVGSGNLQVNAFPTYVGHSYSFFAGDDWKLNRRLTLNLGLRYDFQSPPEERRGQESNFNPFVTNPTNSKLIGAMQYARVDYGDTTVLPDRKNFGPRVGFAWDVSGKATTVVRGAYGILYTPTAGVNFLPSSNGFSNTTNYVAPGNNSNLPSFQLQDGPPFITYPLGVAGGANALLGSSVSFEESRKPIPYSQQWNFSLQHQIRGWVIEASYAGNRGIHLPGVGYDYNSLDPTYLSLGLQLQDQVSNPLAGLVPGALGNPSVARRQTLLPFPQYTSASVLVPRVGNSIYNSLQMKGEHRFSQGVTLLVSYTNAKLITDSQITPIAFLSPLESGLGLAYQNGKYNRRVERAVDPTDISQRFVSSFVYEIPVGHGKLLAPGNRLLNGIIGNWSASGVFTAQDGQPLTIRGANNFLADRPNSTGQSAAISNGNRARWFDTTAFVNPPIYTFGNVGRTLSDVRSPGLIDIDLALLKTLHVYERVAIQIRAEAFNLANTTNLGLPNTTFVPGPDGKNASATFGTITTAFDARSLQFGLKILW
jgi:hypothetical protein